MKVTGYIRVSTDKEGQKESPKNQKHLIIDFITENQYDLYDFYTDVQTGTTDNREGLKKLIHDAENKEFDMIVAKELSRLGRNVELLYQLKRIAETKGVRLITLDGKVDTQDFSKQAMFGCMHGFTKVKVNVSATKSNLYFISNKKTDDSWVVFLLTVIIYMKAN